MTPRDSQMTGFDYSYDCVYVPHFLGDKLLLFLGCCHQGCSRHAFSGVLSTDFLSVAIAQWWNWGVVSGSLTFQVNPLVATVTPTLIYIPASTFYHLSLWPWPSLLLWDVAFWWLLILSVSSNTFWPFLYFFFFKEMPTYMNCPFFFIRLVLAVEFLSILETDPLSESGYKCFLLISGLCSVSLVMQSRCNHISLCSSLIHAFWVLPKIPLPSQYPKAFS